MGRGPERGSPTLVLRHGPDFLREAAVRNIGTMAGKGPESSHAAVQETVPMDCKKTWLFIREERKRHGMCPS